jgi:hypothetical protein
LDLAELRPWQVPPETPLQRRGPSHTERHLIVMYILVKNIITLIIRTLPHHTPHRRPTMPM